ncbi:MAG: hypothetical protein QME40_07055 [bacterium]|nr:hypothetical protein [bacterium]
MHPQLLRDEEDKERSTILAPLKAELKAFGEREGVKGRFENCLRLIPEHKIKAKQMQ